MPIHPAMSSRFPLLESVPSMQAQMEDPAYAQQRAQFESHPDYAVPSVSVRSAEVPGPHGAVPVRVYDPGPVRTDDQEPVRVSSESWRERGSEPGGRRRAEAPRR
jgi:hypothetical protein